MQSSRQGPIIPMQRFCYHVHAGSHQTKRSSCLDSLIRSRWDNFSSNSTGQFIQLENIFHSLVGLQCMIFELRRFLSCSLSYLDYSLPEPYFSQFGECLLFLTLFQMLSNISISPSLIALKIVSSVFVPIVRGTSFPNWVSSSVTKATRSLISGGCIQHSWMQKFGILLQASGLQNGHSVPLLASRQNFLL